MAGSVVQDLGTMVATLDACWLCMDNWPALKDQFETMFRTDDQLDWLDQRGIGPGNIGARAAIAMKWQPFAINPRLNVAVDYPVGVKVEIWRKANQYRKTAYLLEQVIKAWYGAKQGGPEQPTIMSRATCGPPQQIVNVEVTWQTIPQGTAETPVDALRVCYGTAVVMFKNLVQVRNQ